jgi:predicted  nucleic acid-binding Zn-ribbon protein
LTQCVVQGGVRKELLGIQEGIDMAAANSVATRLSFSEVRDSMKRMQDEGEKLVGRLRRDARDLVERRPTVPNAVDAVRKQAEQVARDLESRRDELVRVLRQRVRSLTELIARTLGVAESEEVAELSREVTGLSLRIAELERRVQVLGKQTKKDKKEKAA